MAAFPAMMTRIKSATITHLRDFILAQLIATALSVPVLVCWGLPISAMTFVGNFVFTPVLTLFIATSSLLFFTELLCIPNQFLAQLVSLLTAGWDYCLSWGRAGWLISFAMPPWWMTAGVALLLGLIFLRSTGSWRASAKRKIILLSLFNAGFIAILLIAPRTVPQKTSIDQFPHLHIKVKGPGLISIVDDGFFRRTLSPDKAVLYKIKPELTKQLGSFTVHSLKTTICSYRSLTGLLACAEQLPIKKIVLPYFSGSLTKAGWRAFFRLKRAAREREIVITRFTPKTALERTVQVYDAEK